MKEVIKKYLEPVINDPNHRYKSWENCFTAFENPNNSTDYLSLHLGFYLASWGMYRGSSGLLWKSHKLHNKAVEIIKAHYSLRNKNSVSLPPIDDVLNLVNELSKYYSGTVYYNGPHKKNITATETLISKIILGTLGCLPAFDRYFTLGFIQKEHLNIDKNILDKIWSITNENINQINASQDWIFNKIGIVYPPMKIIDMYYWQKGVDEYGKKLSHKTSLRYSR